MVVVTDNADYCSRVVDFGIVRTDRRQLPVRFCTVVKVGGLRVTEW